MAPSLKLIYFDFPGRAEVIRLALFVGGLDFEDVRLTREQFLAEKADLPFGLLPVLEVDGERISQSLAILRYVGRLSGLFPADPLAAFRCDEIVQAFEDLFDKLRPSMYETDVKKRAAMRAVLAEETIPDWSRRLEGIVRVRGTRYCAGEELTVADLMLSGFWNWVQDGALEGVGPNALEGCPMAAEIAHRVAGHPKVKEYRERLYKKP
eukprot:evm.model.scf_131.2 EVM.evm.TU.scf_131.2   scf_131:15187-15813(-)